MKMIEENIVIRGVEVLFITEGRIVSENRNSNYHYYSVRGDDELTPVTIHFGVWSNHVFDIVTNKPLDHEIDKNWGLELTEEEVEIIYKAFYSPSKIEHAVR